MKKLFNPLAITGILCCTMAFTSMKISPKQHIPSPELSRAKTGRIQVALLLDVSNSMDGLIDQAKAQLWNMVNTFGKATCNNKVPDIEIALYEYGRSSNAVAKGYVKLVSGFTTDLDKLSEELFALKTNGGEEFCGQVIYTSLRELPWDTEPNSYKVIFIAGNEDFLQGNLHYTRACDEAKKKGVIVNTIYCGNRMQGIREHWNLNSECGNGSFTNINQNEKSFDIPTPYDSVLFTMNEKLNGTYIHYGTHGQAAAESQQKVDKMNYNMNSSVAAKRVSVKGKKELYKNPSWDMVDAAEADSKFSEKVDVKTLPDNMKNKSRKEIQEIIETKSAERTKIQKDINSISVTRENWLAKEKLKTSSSGTAATLQSEIEKIIRDQAKRFNMVIL